MAGQARGRCWEGGPVDVEFRIPGTTEPEIRVRRSGFGNLHVLVDGAPAKRRRSRTLSYDIPLADGSVKELRLKGQWTGLKAVVDGVETPLEPPLAGYLRILTFLPVALVVLGPLLGALVGVGAAAINARLARRPMRAPIKIAAMLGVSALALGTFLVATFAIAPIPSLETGRCVNGIREGAEVTTQTTRSVDCGKPHDNEVVGTIQYTGQSGYRKDVLEPFAQTACLEAFAAYVGVDFQVSTLEMIVVTPTDLTWAKGDREIACVVLAGGGGQLTGSVKGTAR